VRWTNLTHYTHHPRPKHNPSAYNYWNEMWKEIEYLQIFTICGLNVCNGKICKLLQCFLCWEQVEGMFVFENFRASTYFGHLVTMWSIEWFSLHAVSHTGAGSLVMRKGWGEVCVTYSCSGYNDFFLGYRGSSIFWLKVWCSLMYLRRLGFSAVCIQNFEVGGVDWRWGWLLYYNFIF